MDQSIESDIDAALKAIVENQSPDIRFLPKYGGEVIAPDPDDDKSFVGGIFAYKDHVSLEFSHGANFTDPEGLLEGKGKHRRHLKLYSAKDVDAKKAEGFIKQALGC